MARLAQDIHQACQRLEALLLEQPAAGQGDAAALQQVQLLQVQLAQLADAASGTIAALIEAGARARRAGVVAAAATGLDTPALATALGYGELAVEGATASSYAAANRSSAAALELLRPGGGGAETAPAYAAGTGAYAGASAVPYTAGVASGEWFQAELPEPAFVTAYAFVPLGPSRLAAAPRSWALLASADGRAWELLDARADFEGYTIHSAASGGERFDIVGARGAYRFYRLVVTRVGQGSATCALRRWQLLGVEQG